MSASLPSVLPREDALEPEFEHVYVRCRSTLRPALSGRLGSAEEADDVLHDAFLRFLHSYAGQAISNPLGLIARIAMNIVRDNARTRKFRQYQLQGIETVVCAPLPGPNPEEACLDRQRQVRLCAAIDSLPPRCREVFLLHRIDDMPQAEVARVLGISRSAVEKNLARADGRLRRDMADGVDSAASRKA
jgi:RNA polymerase sigma factor (sigma-70 family)